MQYWPDIWQYAWFLITIQLGSARMSECNKNLRNYAFNCSFKGIYVVKCKRLNCRIQGRIIWIFSWILKSTGYPAQPYIGFLKIISVRCYKTLPLLELIFTVAWREWAQTLRIPIHTCGAILTYNNFKYSSNTSFITQKYVFGLVLS